MCNPNILFQIHFLRSVFYALQPNPCFFHFTVLTRITNISSRSNLNVCIIIVYNTCAMFDTVDPCCFLFTLQSREQHFIPTRKCLICGNFVFFHAFMSGLQFQFPLLIQSPNLAKALPLLFSHDYNFRHEPHGLLSSASLLAMDTPYS